jgi:hypothetical protein
VRALAAAALAAALGLGGCAKPLVTDAERDPTAAPGSVTIEPAVVLPPLPKDQDLLRFDVFPRTALEYFVDATSIALPGEGIVRFTVVARTASAANVSYEGFRCITREHKIYARGSRGGAWTMTKDPGWEPISDRSTPMYRRELYWNFLCPAKHAVSSPREGADALRYGRHPNARPEGSLAD